MRQRTENCVRVRSTVLGVLADLSAYRSLDRRRADARISADLRWVCGDPVVRRHSCVCERHIESRCASRRATAAAGNPTAFMAPARDVRADDAVTMAMVT